MGLIVIFCSPIQISIFLHEWPTDRSTGATLKANCQFTAENTECIPVVVVEAVDAEDPLLVSMELPETVIKY